MLSRESDDSIRFKFCLFFPIVITRVSCRVLKLVICLLITGWFYELKRGLPNLTSVFFVSRDCWPFYAMSSLPLAHKRADSKCFCIVGYGSNGWRTLDSSAAFL